MATTLPLVASVCTGLLADRLAVGNAGFACLQVNTIFTLDALIGLRLNIVDMTVGFERTGVDAEIADSAYLSCCGFKDKHREVVVKGLCIFGYRICCAGQIIYNGIEERLYADIFASRAT